MHIEHGLALPTSLARLAALLVCGVAACTPGEDVSSTEAWEFPDWDKEDALADGPNATTDATVEVFRGYNVVTDVALGTDCVVPEQERYRAGATAWSETMTIVETIDELHTALQIDAKAQVKAGPLALEGGTSLTQSFKSSETSLSLLLRAHASYGVMNLDPVTLTDEALALAKKSPAEFTRHCGTHYLAGINFGADLRVLITIETSSFEDKEAVKSELAVKGIKAGPATVGAEVRSEVSEILANTAVSVTATAEALGFGTEHSLAALEGNPLESAAGLVESIKKDLSASIERDQCSDGGRCDSGEPVGYINNGNRSAIPVGVLKRTYRTAGNFPRDAASVDAFVEHDNTIAEALALVEEHARIYATVSGIYADEVGAILESATPYDFAFYARDEFGSSAASEDRLLDRAKALKATFDPDTGSATEAIADSLGPCWDRAVQGDFSACTGSDLEPVDDILAAYAQRRIRPVYYTLAVDETVEWQDAACPAGTKLPDRFEASRLYAAVWRNQEIPQPRFTEKFFGGENRGLWVDDRGQCDQDHGMWVHFRSDALEYGCYENRLATIDIELPALCVPTAGPFGPGIDEL